MQPSIVSMVMDEFQKTSALNINELSKKIISGIKKIPKSKEEIEMLVEDFGNVYLGTDIPKNDFNKIVKKLLEHFKITVSLTKEQKIDIVYKELKSFKNEVKSVDRRSGTILFYDLSDVDVVNINNFLKHNDWKEINVESFGKDSKQITLQKNDITIKTIKAPQLFRIDITP